MNYEEAISYLEGIAPFGIQPGLERITALLDELGNPQNKYKTIHVTGTNGKGSVSTYIAYGLQVSGIKTGLFTSPHLGAYNERIRINEHIISSEDFGALIEEVSLAVKCIEEKGVESPTQFEVLTAAGFLYFAKCEVEYAVIEVGLGGSLDSTNVIIPEVSVITNVTIDHTEYCGTTVEEIAEVKAGIIKKGVPVVTAAQSPALEIIKKEAQAKQAKYYVFNTDFGIDSRSSMKMGQMITVSTKDGQKAMLFTSLLGVHQAVNLACATQALWLLMKKENRISEETMREGLARARWACRFEVLDVQGRTVILDGAHNEAGAEAFQLTYKEIFEEQPKTIVLSILKDKDISSMVSQLVSKEDCVITVPAPTPRTMDPKELAQTMPVTATWASSVTEGLDKALEMTKPGDIIAVCGSLYIQGEAQDWYRKRGTN